MNYKYYALPPIDAKRLTAKQILDKYGKTIFDENVNISVEKLKKLVRALRQEKKNFESFKNVAYFNAHRLKVSCARFYDLNSQKSVWSAFCAVAERIFGSEPKHIYVEPYDAIIGRKDGICDKYTFELLVTKDFDEHKKYSVHDIAMLTRKNKAMLVGYKSAFVSAEKFKNILDNPSTDWPAMFSIDASQKYYKTLKSDIEQKFESDFAEYMGYYNKAKVVLTTLAYMCVKKLSSKMDQGVEDSQTKKDINYCNLIEKTL